MKRLLTLIMFVALALLISRASQSQARVMQTYQPISHIVLIMEENHSPTQAYAAMPYFKSLSQTYGVETNDWGVAFPSLPNYIALTSGSIPADIKGKDCTPSSTCDDTGTSIFSQGSWNVWAESMPKPCYKSNTSLYAPRHTAAPYYTQLAKTCATFDKVLPSTPTISANFTLVAPNLNDDAHNGTLAQADTWLKNFIPKLTSQSAYTDGSTLIEITFDTASGNCGSSCASPVALVLLNPRLSHKSVSTKINHYSVLRLNEEELGYPLLGAAKTATDIRAAFGL